MKCTPTYTLDASLPELPPDSLEPEFTLQTLYIGRITAMLQDSPELEATLQTLFKKINGNLKHNLMDLRYSPFDLPSPLQQKSEDSCSVTGSWPVLYKIRRGESFPSNSEEEDHICS